MSLQDPISDMLTRIRNGQLSNKEYVDMPFSKEKKAIASVLAQEGYVISFETFGEGVEQTLRVTLKYYEGRPVIDLIKRISRPSLRIYKKCDELPKVRSGLGVALISTSKGIMSDKAAREFRLGGEVLCEVA